MKVQRPALTQEVRFASVASGARIAWARSGRTGAATLLHAAHWMTHVEYDLGSLLWAPWIERMGRDLQLVRYDERGCGLSSPDEVPLGLDSLVEELDAVVCAQSAPRVALLGASGAAATAVAYAALHPERLSHLVLLGGYQRGLLRRDPSAETLAFFDAQERLMALGWGRNDPAVQTFFSTRFLPDAPRAALDALNEQQRRSCDGRRAAAVMRARASLDVSALAPQVRVPTLVLHSEGDLAVPIALGLELAAAIPGARFESLHCRNHIPVATDAAFERLCLAVHDFVCEPEPGPVLTRRERELGALVGRGLDNLQIAAQLGLAEKTVRNMVSALYTKLGVEGRAMAVVRSRDLGL